MGVIVFYILKSNMYINAKTPYPNNRIGRYAMVH